MDEFMTNYIIENNQRLFKGKQMTYKPALLTKEGYPALLRSKIQMGGSRVCKFWTPEFKKTEAPEDLRECGLIPRVLIKGLWIMGSECGLTFEVTDLICDYSQETCPFLTSDPILA